jgi:dipeptidyl aminopeptidase/acylaminoacyl peptidase
MSRSLCAKALLLIACTSTATLANEGFFEKIDTSASEVVVDVRVHHILPGYSPTWMPTAQGIVYISEEPYQINVSGLMTRIVYYMLNYYEIGGNEKRTLKLKSDGFLANPDVSPDGKAIVYTAQDNGNCSIWVYDVETDNERKVSSFYASASSPSWSPDGKSIVFAALIRPFWRLIKIDLEAGK